MEACASKLKLNILQVGSVYLFPLTPRKQERRGACHYPAHSHTSVFRHPSVVGVCVWMVMTALLKSK